MSREKGLKGPGVSFLMLLSNFTLFRKMIINLKFSITESDLDFRLVFNYFKNNIAMLPGRIVNAALLIRFFCVFRLTIMFH